MDNIEPKYLKRINNGLGVLVIVLALYISMFPFLPQMMWWLKREAPVVSSPPPVTATVIPVPKENRLIIPRLELDQEILEGDTIATVDRGIWHRPGTSSPESGSNTVLVGHRFTYAGNAVFYHLDKVILGDEIVVWWAGKRYVYKVTTTKVVPATETSVEQPTREDILTLYTCTPVWSAKDRLVVQAVPVEEGL